MGLRLRASQTPLTKLRLRASQFNSFLSFFNTRMFFFFKNVNSSMDLTPLLVFLLFYGRRNVCWLLVVLVTVHF